MMRILFALLPLATVAATSPEALPTSTVLLIAAAIAGVVVLRGVLLRRHMRKRHDRRREKREGVPPENDGTA